MCYYYLIWNNQPLIQNGLDHNFNSIIKIIRLYFQRITQLPGSYKLLFLETHYNIIQIYMCQSVERENSHLKCSNKFKRLIIVYTLLHYGIQNMIYKSHFIISLYENDIKERNKDLRFHHCMHHLWMDDILFDNFTYSGIMFQISVPE